MGWSSQVSSFSRCSSLSSLAFSFLRLGFLGNTSPAFLAARWRSPSIWSWKTPSSLWRVRDLFPAFSWRCRQNLMVDSSQRFEFETTALRLVGCRETLDETIFGIPIAQIMDIKIRDSDAACYDFRKFTDWCEQRHIKFCWTRLPTGDIIESLFLQQRGFRFIESGYTVCLSGLQDRPLSKSDVVVSAASVDDSDELVAMAEKVFRFGRYHRDPLIDSGLADKRYGHWLKRAFANPDQSVMRCVYE